MATDDALLTLRDQMREHRIKLASSTFDIEDLIRAVDTLLEVEELKLEALVKKLIRARQQRGAVERGEQLSRRRRKPVH